MKKILNIISQFGLLTGSLILISISLNKVFGKYFFLYLKTQKLARSKVSFKHVNHGIIQLNYKNLVINCRKYSSDIDVFNQIFVNNEFNDLFQIIEKQDLHIQTVIDLGANIGMASLCFKLKYNNLKIYTVEPDSDNFKVLDQNLILNKVDSININKGIWRDSRKLYFDKSFRDGQKWSVTLTEEPKSKEFISSISIDDLIKQYKIERIDLLKIDIEGGEVMVFNENFEGLSFLKITKIIAIEIHKEFNIKERITSILKQNNFSFHQSGEYFIGINETI